MFNFKLEIRNNFNFMLRSILMQTYIELFSENLIIVLSEYLYSDIKNLIGINNLILNIKKWKYRS